MSARRASPFSRVAVLGMVVVGFIAFIAMLYFLSVGDTGERENDGGAHAAANGLNGYSGLAKLLEAEGYEVTKSREQRAMDTTGLLVLTPPAYVDPEDLSRILRERAYTGPTLVIVPKWSVSRFPPNPGPEVSAKIKDGWVQLGFANVPGWLSELDKPFAIEAKVETDKQGAANWAGLQTSGELPRAEIVGAKASASKQALIVDDATRSLVVTLSNVDEFGNSDDTEPVTFIIEPDLVNNMGMNDAQRAALALRIVDQAGYGPEEAVTFDLTLNGLGASTNLLTLAFRPPFLAATLCLLLAMVIVGWRAFKRFGPPVASGPALAFGKSRLVSNGAGLIIRARRMRLLGDPYADLSARRLAHALGLAKPDPEAIDAAIRRRLPNEEPFSHRAARLRDATSSSDILRAAKALKELEGKLTK